MKIHFENVGRGKASWSAEVKQVSYSALLKQVRPHLMARDVEFSFDEDGQGGDVIVGGFRHVGRFKLEGVTIGEVVHVTL